MKAFHTIVMDKNSAQPLYLQLAGALGKLIEEGVLPPNSKLPPIRSLATKLRVNAVTVVGAYQYLRNKGVIYSQVGSGTYVSPLPVESLTPPVPYRYTPAKTACFDMANSINFANTALPHALFPTEQFKEAFQAVLDREAGGAFGYLEQTGYLPLREILCEYLEDYGIYTTSDAIQILSGGQQGLDIVSKALMGFGDVVFVERPTFYGAAGAFLSRGAKVIEISMEQDGMDIEMLENMMKVYRPKLLYMMAYFQTPTGISYSLEKKRRILSLCEKYDAVIIEDDTLYDFHYTEQRITPMRALDYKNKVVYIKSFSKILMPGLRVGFMVIPKSLRENVAAVRGIADISASGFIQKALEYYLRKWGWKDHTQMIREYGARQYQYAIQAAKRYLNDAVLFYPPNGGISIWIRLKEGVSAAEFGACLLERGVVVSLGSQYDTMSGDDSHIRVCFASLSKDEIDRGFQIMGETLEGII